MPGACASWGFPLSLRCKLDACTAHCIGSLASLGCWGCRHRGERHPSRPHCRGACRKGAPWHLLLDCLAAEGCLLLQRRMFCSVEGQESWWLTLRVLAFLGFAKEEQLCQSKRPCRHRGCRCLGLWAGGESLPLWGWHSPAGNIPTSTQGLATLNCQSSCGFLGLSSTLGSSSVPAPHRGASHRPQL